MIRYLLEPCFMMYDNALAKADNDKSKIEFIEPSIQTAHLEAMSKRRWEWIRVGFNNNVRGCSREDAQRLYQLVDNIPNLFKFRLHNHLSEPRAITFSISALQSLDAKHQEDLERILRIARRAQILFMRPSTAKDEGRQDDYYTFDRLLWVDRGLDPVGQNARVSIEARFLWEAAFENKAIPTSSSEKKDRAKDIAIHPDLFKELGQ